MDTPFASYLPAFLLPKMNYEIRGMSEPSVRQGTVGRNLNTCHATLDFSGRGTLPTA